MARLQTIPSRLGKLPTKRQAAPSNTESWRNDKRTAAQRGYGYKWQQARAEHLAEHPHCVMCLAELGMTDLQPADVIVRCAQMGVPEPLATVVDHTVKHEGDQRLFWRRDLWQSLCSHHHNADAQRRDKGGSQRPRIGQDGWPVED